MHGVGQRVLGQQAQRAGHVAELHVEVDEHGGAHARAGQADGEVGGDGGLADPALRRADDDDAVAAVAGGLAQGVAAGRGPLGAAGDHAVDVVLVRVGGEQVAHTGVHRPHPQVGVGGVGRHDDARRGGEDVGAGGQGQGPLLGHVGPEDGDAGRAGLHDAGEEPAVGVQGLDTEGEDVAVARGGEALDELGADADGQDGAHELPPEEAEPVVGVSLPSAEVSPMVEPTDVDTEAAVPGCCRVR